MFIPDKLLINRMYIVGTKVAYSIGRKEKRSPVTKVFLSLTTAKSELRMPTSDIAINVLNNLIRATGRVPIS
jgi:hypothetical protein